MSEDKPTKAELIEMTTYSIWRTGNQCQRHYQLNKMVMGVVTEQYWVQLKGSSTVYCNCPGFQRQQFPKIEHKHVKIAQDFSDRGEPNKALYKIHGTGEKNTIEYLGAKA